MGTFDERIAELSDRVGHGDLQGRVEVNQVYSRYQHEGLDLNHPRGGGPKFLQRPMVDHADEHMRTLAKTALEPEGPGDGMRRVVEEVSKGVTDSAPVEFDHLRRSGHPTVVDNGITVYDRAPEVARLTEEELRALSRLRGGHPYGSHGHVHGPHNQGHHR